MAKSSRSLIGTSPLDHEPWTQLVRPPIKLRVSLHSLTSRHGRSGNLRSLASVRLRKGLRSSIGRVSPTRRPLLKLWYERVFSFIFEAVFSYFPRLLLPSWTNRDQCSPLLVALPSLATASFAVPVANRKARSASCPFSNMVTTLVSVIWVC